MNPRSFRYEEDGPVARITLDRPEVLNALTFEVYRELTDTFRALAGRKPVRVAVITGRGRAFCTGGDVKEIIGELLKYDRLRLEAFTRLTCDLIRAMRGLPQPIVASLNGPAAGAGAAIALASDFRVAADTARIAFLFVKVGRVGQEVLQKSRRGTRRVNGPGETGPREARQIASVVDMRVGEHHRVHRACVERRRRPVLLLQLARSLEHATVDENPARARFEEVFRAGHRAASSQEAERRHPSRIIRGRDPKSNWKGNCRYMIRCFNRR